MSEEPVQRRLAAIMAADVAGYTRLMEEDSEGTVAAWRAARDGVIEPAIDAGNGRVVKPTGDGFLAEFPTVQDAVNCAIQLQDGLASSRLEFRIGVNLGDIIDDGRDIHGEGVNVAARIEALAEPGGICISGMVYESVRNRIDADYRGMGEQTVKNVSAPVRVYALGPAATPAAQQPQATGRPSIAVLPFDNVSGDAEQEYFSDGIAEDIITDLSKISTLMVVARNSSFTYKGRAVDVRTVAKELGVAYVLEGSVRKAGGRVRITAQLVDGSDGAHLWADRYDRELEDIFAVQDEVAKHIIEALQVTLSPADEARLGGPGTGNVEAYDYLLRGRELLYRFTEEATLEAMEMFEKSMELDSVFAAPRSELALAHYNQFVSGWRGAGLETLQRGCRYSEEAVALDGGDSHANCMLAIGRLWLRDIDGAVDAIDRAMALDPNSAAVLSARGHILGYAGRYEEAIENLKTAMRLDPHYVTIWLHFQAHANALKGEYEEAIPLLQQRIRRNPETDISRVLLASCYGHLGRIDDAREIWRQVAEVNPEYSLEQKANVLPYKDPADWQRIVAGLAKAGLVDKDGQGPADNTASRPSIAVLPFDNLSGDAEQEYFSDGISEDIITALARFPTLRVAARNSSFSYKGQSPDVREVAANLDVRYVLEGSVRKAGGRVRITAQLIDGTNGDHIWAERYDRELEDIFDVQDEITQTVTAAIEPELAAAEQKRAQRKSPASLDAWDFYQRAMVYYYRRDKESCEEAIRLLHQSLALDPGFSRAWAALTDVLFNHMFLGNSDDEDGDRARMIEAGNNAVRFDNDDPAAHEALGRANIWQRDHVGARNEFAKAIELNPASARGHYGYGMVILHAGDAAKAVSEFETAINLSPRDPYRSAFYSRMAYGQLALKNHEAAVDWAKQAISEPIREWTSNLFLVSALGHMERLEDAKPALEDLYRAQPNVSLAYIQKLFPSVPEYLDYLLDGLRKAGLREE